MNDILELIKEANRLMREGGTPEERDAFMDRKKALLNIPGKAEDDDTL